ncbi:MAG TPA: MAPEG family protein [Pseudomonadales bacterium]
MSVTATALIALAGWFLLLAILIVLFRGFIIAAQGRAANDFNPDGSDVSPFSARLSRVHANCVENIPLMGMVLLYAIASGKTGITDPLAMYLLYARIGQSSVHLISTSVAAVMLRGTLYSVQLGITGWFIFKLAMA